MNTNQVHVVPRLLRFTESKRDQVITIENNTNDEINYEFSAAKYEEIIGKTVTLFQSNLPNGKIRPKNKERIIIQYIGKFTKKETERAEILQVVINDGPHFQQIITIDCEFESPALDKELNELVIQKSDDDLKKIVNILNLSDEDKQSKKSKLVTINEILKPLTPKFKSKKLKNLNVLTCFIFMISLILFGFSIYIAFLNGYNSTFQTQIVEYYGLEKIVKLCLEENIQSIYQWFARPNSSNLQDFYSFKKETNKNDKLTN